MNQKLDLEPAATRLAAADEGPSLRQLLLRVGVPLVIILVAALLSWQLLGSSPQATRKERARDPRLVETIPVALTSPAVQLQAWGEVQPAQDVVLKAQVSGAVIDLNALEPGSFVRKGDLLLQLDTADFELALSQRRSELDQVLANLEIEQGNQAIARSEFALLGGQATAAEQARMLRGPQLQAANAQVAAARAAVAEAELQLARAQIKAPFDAVVTQRHVNLGSHVSVNGDLVALVGTGAAWLEVSVPVTQLRWIRFPGEDDPVGSAVNVFYDQVWPSQQYRSGTVIRLLSDLEASGRMARVLVRVDDPFARQPQNSAQPRLLLGAFVRVEIEGVPIADAAVIPRALLHDNDTVWVLKDQRELEIRPVTVAYQDQQNVYVSAGLVAGEQLISSSIGTATDGMLVRVETAAQPPGDATDE